jgi:hypothetical protein
MAVSARLASALAKASAPAARWVKFAVIELAASMGAATVGEVLRRKRGLWHVCPPL